MLMSVCSDLLARWMRSVRLASALRIAASTSTGCGASVGCSAGSSFVVQKSGCDGFMTSMRRLSSAVWICPGDDDLLLGARDFRFRLRRCRSAPSCRASTVFSLFLSDGLRELERLLRHLELADAR